MNRIHVFVKSIFSRIATQVGLDRVVFATVCGQFIAIAIGPGSLYFIGTFFSKTEQGYYYTFGSVLALQNLLELGFSTCIINFASHEFAYVQMDKDGMIYGNIKSKNRLISLIRLSLKWYGIMSILFFILVGTGGHLFFSFQEDYGIHWSIPWWSLCFVSAINIVTIPLGAFLEGCNQYLWIAYARIWTRLATAAVLWLSLAAGAGLYSASLSLSLAVLLFLLLFCLKWKGLLHHIFRDNIQDSFSWEKEILPLQWRIAIAWVCGYFTFSLFNPVLFAFQGPVVAGQMGMTFTLISSFAGMASSWINVKVSSFGMLVSKKEWGSLDKLWLKSTIQSLAIAIAGVVFILIAVVYIKERYSIGERFLGYKEIAVLCAATIVNLIIFCQNLYMRAHREEPFLKIFILNAILTASSVYLAGKYFNVLTVCMAYLFFITLSMLLTSIVFVKYKKEWHYVS